MRFRSKVNHNIILNLGRGQHFDQWKILIVRGTGMANMESPPSQRHDTAYDGCPFGDEITIDLFGSALFGVDN